MIEGVVRSVLEPPARPADDPDGRRHRRHGRDPGDVVQPAVARGEARRRNARPAARQAEPLRLRRRELRPGRRRRHRRLRARLPGHRGPRPEDAARPDGEGARARPRRRRAAAGGAARAARPAAPRRRLPGAAPPALARRGRGGAPPARLRRAARPPARHSRAARPSARPTSPRRCRRPGELVARYRDGAPVHAHRAPGARDRRDRRRPRAHDADAAAAAGRRRLGEDRRRALRAAARGRGRPPGRADGADRDARRAALPHDRGALHRARRPVSRC